MSSRAIIALGSNARQAEANFGKALEAMCRDGNVTVVKSTQRVWTKPVACDGIVADCHQFLNCLIAIDTTLDYAMLNGKLKEVEAECGATKADKWQGRVAIDLDILSFGDERYHLDDWNRQYIQALIQEL